MRFSTTVRELRLLIDAAVMDTEAWQAIGRGSTMKLHLIHGRLHGDILWYYISVLLHDYHIWLNRLILVNIWENVFPCFHTKLFDNSKSTEHIKIHSNVSLTRKASLIFQCILILQQNYQMWYFNKNIN